MKVVLFSRYFSHKFYNFIDTKFFYLIFIFKYFVLIMYLKINLNYKHHYLEYGSHLIIKFNWLNKLNYFI